MKVCSNAFCMLIPNHFWVPCQKIGHVFVVIFDYITQKQFIYKFVWVKRMKKKNHNHICYTCIYHDIRWVHLLMFQHYYLHFGGSFMSKNGHFMLVVTRGGFFLFFVFIIYSRGWLYNDRKLCQDMITWLFVLQKRLFLGRRIYQVKICIEKKPFRQITTFIKFVWPLFLVFRHFN